jgi:hypothetical protein
VRLPDWNWKNQLMGRHGGFRFEKTKQKYQQDSTMDLRVKEHEDGFDVECCVWRRTTSGTMYIECHEIEVWGKDCEEEKCGYPVMMMMMMINKT